MTKQKRSTFKILFYLKKNSPNKNGLVPVMGRITIDGKIAQFSAKLECNPLRWDLKSGRVPGRSDEAVRLNGRLTSIRSQIDAHYYAMVRDEGFACADKIKCKLPGINEPENMVLAAFSAYNEAVFGHLRKYISSKFRSKDIRGLAEGSKVLPVPCYQTYWAALRRVMVQAGFGMKITSHCARHTFATLFLTEGVSIESVSSMLGHTSIKTTQIYARITNEKVSRDMDLAAQKLQGLASDMGIAG